MVGTQQAGAAADLAGIHGNDGGQLQLLLRHTHSLGLVPQLALAHLPALLVLDGAEHPERSVLPCSVRHNPVQSLMTIA